ncbi:hypothetical protein B7486_23325 [cyanobacterium TDX16]|nr:hypothetical protein B7486_23325 [cyanobacterium TDX16]
MLKQSKKTIGSAIDSRQTQAEIGEIYDRRWCTRIKRLLECQLNPVMRHKSNFSATDLGSPQSKSKR